MEPPCLDHHCIQCCTQTNMVLSNQDIQTIERLGFSSGFFIQNNNGWLQLKNRQNRCVFHNGEYCIIYENRPLGCKLYPLVYQEDTHKVIFDAECPYTHQFTLTTTKQKQLIDLVNTLRTERNKRLNEQKK